MADHFAACVARLRDAAGDVCGAGFLIGGRHVMTCAHVVNAALGLNPGAQETPQARVLLELPFAADEIFQARVVAWYPMLAYADRDGRQLSDIAVLSLEAGCLESGALPAAVPARLVQGQRNGGQAVRCFGFPACSGMGGQIAQAETIAEDATGWLHLRPVSEPVITAGYSGTPVFDAASGEVIGMVTAFDATMAYGTASHRLQQAWPQLARPYKGLASFEPGDAEFFFGRESAVEQLRLRLERERLVMVVGASGGGKSSLVHGGLVPRLKDRNGWRIALLRPGADPLLSLSGAVARALGGGAGGDLVRRLTRGSGAKILARLVELLKFQGPGARLLLVVDAFEELFTQCADPQARAGLAGLVAAIGRQRGDGPVALVGTLRADFTGAVLRDGVLGAAFDGHYLMLRAMKGAELGRAIRLPAQRFGVRFETGVDDDLLAAVARDPGCLPLMEFVLERLWAEQQDHVLSRAAYEAMGGLGGALARHADDVIDAMDPASRLAARHLLCRLVQVAPPGKGEDAKRPQSRAGLGEELWQAARLLAGEAGSAGRPARLLILSRDQAGEERADIIHEALLRYWPRLREWLDEERSLLVLTAELQLAWQRWSGAERDDRLLRGRDLAEALAQRSQILAHCPELSAFLDRSEQAAQWRSARRQADALWENLEFQGGCASAEDWQTLERLAGSGREVRQMFMRRLCEVPERGRRFCRLPGPVIRAVLGWHQDGAEELAALIRGHAANRDARIVPIAWHCWALLRADPPETRAFCNAGDGFAVWAQALAPSFSADRAAEVLAQLLDGIASGVSTDVARWVQAGEALAGRLRAEQASELLRRAVALAPGQGRIGRALALRMQAPDGAILERILGSIAATGSQPAIQALVAPATVLAGQLNNAAAARMLTSLADAIGGGAGPGQLRALAMVALAVPAPAAALCATRAETLLRRLWDDGRYRVAPHQALSEAALTLAAALDGAWPARVLDRVLEAIGQSQDPEELRALGDAAARLAAGLEAAPAARGFGRVIDLLDWSGEALRRQALGSVASALAGALTPDDVAPALDLVLGALERADTADEISLLGQLAAALAVLLAPEASAGMAIRVAGLIGEGGSPPRMLALGRVLHGLADRLEAGAAHAVACQIARLAQSAQDLAGLLALGMENPGAIGCERLLASLDETIALDPPLIAALVSIATNPGFSQPGALLESLLARLLSDPEPQRFMILTKLVLGLAQAGLPVPPGAAQSALRVILARIREATEVGILARAAAALARLLPPGPMAGWLLQEALEWPQTALDGADQVLAAAVTRVAG